MSEIKEIKFDCSKEDLTIMAFLKLSWVQINFIGVLVFYLINIKLLLLLLCFRKLWISLN